MRLLRPLKSWPLAVPLSRNDLAALFDDFGQFGLRHDVANLHLCTMFMTNSSRARFSGSIRISQRHTATLFLQVSLTAAVKAASSARTAKRLGLDGEDERPMELEKMRRAFSSAFSPH